MGLIKNKGGVGLFQISSLTYINQVIIPQDNPFSLSRFCYLRNDSDRKFLCNYFAKNCYKSFDVKTTDNLILLVSSKSITLKWFTELLLNKLLTCCNFPSTVVLLLCFGFPALPITSFNHAVIFSWKAKQLLRYHFFQDGGAQKS